MYRLICLSLVAFFAASGLYAQTPPPQTAPGKPAAPTPAKPAAPAPARPTAPAPAKAPETAPAKPEVAAAKPEAAPAKPAINTRKLAEDWIDRFNALSMWRISFEGQEVGIDQVVDKMAELFAPNVIAEMPQTDPDQIGPVLLMGDKNLRGWFLKIARTEVNLAFIAKRQTTKDVEGELVTYSTNLPWGGLGLSFEILANYTRREDRKRFMSPGAVFLQYGTDGKINRVRMLFGDIEEVTY